MTQGEIIEVACRCLGVYICDFALDQPGWACALTLCVGAPLLLMPGRIARRLHIGHHAGRPEAGALDTPWSHLLISSMGLYILAFAIPSLAGFAAELLRDIHRLSIREVIELLWMPRIRLLLLRLAIGAGLVLGWRGLRGIFRAPREAVT